MPRITLVKSSRKEWTCSICIKPILRGQSYYWGKPMHGSKVCTHQTCGPPRRSMLTTSDKLGRVYAVQEDFEAWGADADAANLRDLIETAQSELEEVASEYQEGADTQDEFFPGSPVVDEIQQKADEVEEWVQELDTLEGDLDDYEQACEDAAEAWTDEEDIASERESALEDLKTAVENFSGQCPF